MMDSNTWQPLDYANLPLFGKAVIPRTTGMSSLNQKSLRNPIEPSSTQAQQQLASAHAIRNRRRVTSGTLASTRPTVCSHRHVACPDRIGTSEFAPTACKIIASHIVVIFRSTAINKAVSADERVEASAPAVTSAESALLLRMV